MAREAYRALAAVLGLPRDLAGDGVTMASELAANTLHTRDNHDLDDARGQLPGCPELWAYLRWSGGQWELACKVFDAMRGWKDGSPPVPRGGGHEALSGRGLQVVAALSGGRWGHHLTRSRLGGWKLPGKAVWFAQPVPPDVVPAGLGPGRLAAGRATRALAAMLSDRGLGGGLLHAVEPSDAMAVLSVRTGLTVWCSDNMIWWRANGARYQCRAVTDLVDTAEELVRVCAEMDGG